MCAAASAAKTISAACSYCGTWPRGVERSGPSQPSRAATSGTVPTARQQKETMIHVGATAHCTRGDTRGTGRPDRTHASSASADAPSTAATTIVWCKTGLLATFQTCEINRDMVLGLEVPHANRRKRPRFGSRREQFWVLNHKQST